MVSSNDMKFPSNTEYALWKLGQSVQGRSLDAIAIAPSGATDLIPDAPQAATWPWVLLIGGVHGDEYEGVCLIEHMRTLWTKHYPFQKVGVVLWAQVNPDGYHLGQRWNAQSIDLNRNLPSKDWTSEVKNPRYPPGTQPGSEPENKALIRLIEKICPVGILTAHSYEKPQININGPSMDWGKYIAEVCDYPITEDIGYPTPGSLGTYAGAEKHTPVITFEILAKLSKEEVIVQHEKSMLQAVKYWENFHA